jgi:hypothetical protein
MPLDHGVARRVWSFAADTWKDAIRTGTGRVIILPRGSEQVTGRVVSCNDAFLHRTNDETRCFCLLAVTCQESREQACNFNGLITCSSVVSAGVGAGSGLRGDQRAWALGMGVVRVAGSSGKSLKPKRRASSVEQQVSSLQAAVPASSQQQQRGNRGACMDPHRLIIIVRVIGGVSSILVGLSTFTCRLFVSTRPGPKARSPRPALCNLQAVS